MLTLSVFSGIVKDRSIDNAVLFIRKGPKMSWSKRPPEYLNRICAEASATPCTETQILELIAKSRSGDSKARETLVRKMMAFAAAFARSMEYDYSNRIPMEDFLQAALEGLLEAIDKTFDPGRGAKFTTAAWYRMRKRCLEMAGMRHAVKAPRGAQIGTVSFEASERIGADGDESPSLEKFLAIEETGPESSVAIARSWPVVLTAMADAIDALDDTNRAAMIRRSLQGSEMMRTLRDPKIQPHRVTLWKHEPLAMSEVFGLMTAALSVDDIVLTLQLIHGCHGRNGFDDSFENACAF